MINYKLICKIIGSLLIIESTMMLWSLVVSLIYHEDDIFAFFSSIILAILAGITLRFIGHHASNNLGRRDAYLVVTLVWIIFSAF